MKRRAAPDARWSMLFIIAWLVLCIAMLIRWRCTCGPPQL